MVTFILSLGANLGDRLQSLQRAAALLAAHPDISLSAVSSVYETDPVDCGNGDPLYYNIILVGETALHPPGLLLHCQQVERRLGRERPYANAPRIIDIDILLMENITVSLPDLTIPHPRMWERGFVLIPLAEMFPDKQVFAYYFAEKLTRIDQKSVRKINGNISLNISENCT